MSKPFYAEGLRFSCQRCSKCCRFEPGFVFLSEKDLSVLSGGMGMDTPEFIRLYCRKVSGSRLALKEKPNLDCVLWDGGACCAYAHRPLQCKSYPFWHSHLSSCGSWENLACSCPGVGKGRVHSREEIELWLRKTEEEHHIKRSLA